MSLTDFVLVCRDDISLNSVIVSNPTYYETSQKEMLTERERMLRAKYFLFVVRKPDPQAGSGGVVSNVRPIAYSESFARTLIHCATVSAVDGARTSMALASKEVQIDNSDANMNRDFTSFGDRTGRALDDNDRVCSVLFFLEFGLTDPVHINRTDRRVSMCGRDWTCSDKWAKLTTRR